MMPPAKLAMGWLDAFCSCGRGGRRRPPCRQGGAARHMNRMGATVKPKAWPCRSYRVSGPGRYGVLVGGLALAGEWLRTDLFIRRSASKKQDASPHVR